MPIYLHQHTHSYNPTQIVAPPSNTFVYCDSDAKVLAYYSLASSSILGGNSEIFFIYLSI